MKVFQPFIYCVGIVVAITIGMFQTTEIQAVGSAANDCNTPGLYDKYDCASQPGKTCPNSAYFRACKASQTGSNTKLCESGEGGLGCSNSNCVGKNSDALSTSACNNE